MNKAPGVDTVETTGRSLLDVRNDRNSPSNYRLVSLTVNIL